MNIITRLIATIIFGLLVTTIAVVIGMTILGVGHAHAAGTHPTASYAVTHSARAAQK
jgi:hypothetical protein